MPQEQQHQEDLIRMMEETKAFAQLQPWTWLDDNDLFAFRLEGEEPVYCSVMGAGGDLSGIAFYSDSTGLQGFVDTMEDRMDRVDLYFSQSSYILEMTDREELQRQEYETIRSSGVRFRGRGQWPSWMHLRPGYLPELPVPGEYAMLADWLKAAGQSALRLQKNPEHRQLLQTGHCMLFVFDQAGGVSEQKLDIEQELERSHLKETAHPVHHDLQVRSLREQCRQMDQVWEIDAFYQGVPVEGDPPFVPLLLLMIDPGEGAVLGSHMAHPSTQAQEFQEYLFAHFSQHRQLPRQVVTTNSRLHGMLAPLLSRLGVEFVEVEELFIIPHIKEQLREEIEEHFEPGPNG